MDCCSNQVRDEDEMDRGKQRKCTDTFCLSLFLFFWMGLGIIAGFAFYVGDPLRLIYGYDSFGNTCGRRNYRSSQIEFAGMDLRDRPYVFFLDNSNLKKSVSICVSRCPNLDIVNQGGVELFYQQTNSSLCRYDYDLHSSIGSSHLMAAPRAAGNGNFGGGGSNSEVENHNRMQKDTQEGKGPCPKFPVLKSRPLLNRCIPENIYQFGQGIVSSIYDYFNSFDTFKQVVADLMVSWREILAMTALSVVFTLIVVFLIHFMADFVAWILLVVVSVSLVLLTGVMWWTYIVLRWEVDPKYIKYAEILNEKYRNEKTFLVLSIIATVVTVIMLLICLVMRKRVNLVVALFNETSRCIRSMPGLLMQPIWTFLSLIIFLAFWGFLILGIATADYGSKGETSLNLPARRPNFDDLTKSVTFGQQDVSSLKLINFHEASWIRYMWWYSIIAFFWVSEFILGCQQMVIAGAVGDWYFSRDRENISFPVGRSIKRLIWFHMGTVAFGSFLITLLKIPRLILAYIQEKLKNHDEYTLVRGCLYCCSCCMWMLENFIQYLNRNAYSITAIQGTSFCPSARIAFTTIASNALRVAAINSVGDFILFLGKCTVACLTSVVATLILKYNESLNFYAVPLILIFIVSFFIAHCILSVYEMVIDTLFMCFCQDVTQNDGSPGREPFAPPSLLRFMNGSDEADSVPMQQSPMHESSH